MAGFWNKNEKQLTPEQQAMAALKKEIDGMLFKKGTLLATLDEEIKVLNVKMNSIFSKIGIKIYDDRNNEDHDVNVEDEISACEKIEKEIEEKQEKKLEISKRYDDEIAILGRCMQMRARGDQDGMVNFVPAGVPDVNLNAGQLSLPGSVKNEGNHGAGSPFGEGNKRSGRHADDENEMTIRVDERFADNREYKAHEDVKGKEGFGNSASDGAEFSLPDEFFEVSPELSDDFNVMSTFSGAEIAEGVGAYDAGGQFISDGVDSYGGKIAVCEKCGAQYTVGEFVFCENCGARLG